jgi:DNA-binding IclR family transcriptional regulator
VTAEATPPPTENANAPARYRVGSVVRALTILDLVADGPPDGLTLSEIARSLDISKSATYSLIRTLVDSDFVRAVDPGPRYLLGMALVRLGDVATRDVPLRQICEPVLTEMVRDTGLRRSRRRPRSDPIQCTARHSRDAAHQLRRKGDPRPPHR